MINTNPILCQQLFDTRSSTFTYLLTCPATKQSALIDPVLDCLDDYDAILSCAELTLRFVVDTHTHADHITASGTLQRKMQCQLYLPKQSDASCEGALRFEDGERLLFGECSLQAIYTPGHTADSYCFLSDDKLFTGDTLLIGGTGRTDFQGGSAQVQYESLFNKLLLLPDDTEVYPGHDYHGQTVSTIDVERETNPRLQVQSIDDYVTLMAGLNLPMPKHLTVAVPANLCCGINAAE